MSEYKSSLKNVFLVFSLSILFVLVFSSCVAIDTCTTTNSSMKCSYNELNKTKAVFENGKELKVKKGQIVEVKYNSIVNSGEITFNVEFKHYKVNLESPILKVQYSNNKILWNLTLNSNGADIVAIPIKEDGAVGIHIIGAKVNGNYKLNWKII